MLQSIRNRLTGWVAIGFIILIGVPLALTFGTGDLTTGGSNYAARVNGEEIPRSRRSCAARSRRSSRWS